MRIVRRVKRNRIIESLSVKSHRRARSGGGIGSLAQLRPSRSKYQPRLNTPKWLRVDK